jgi:hypothetical protein
MMMQEIGRRVMLGCVLALVGGLAAAADPADAQRCATLDEDGARLACYDATFGRHSLAPHLESSPATSPSPAAAAPVSSTAPSTDAAKARQEFGLSEAEKRALDTTRPEEPSSITARVAAVKKRPTGEMVVTLDDGQVWVQLDSYTAAVVRPSDEVTIRKASLGSFVLIGANRVAVRVRRTK